MNSAFMGISLRWWHLPPTSRAAGTRSCRPGPRARQRSRGDQQGGPAIQRRVVLVIPVSGRAHCRRFDRVIGHFARNGSASMPAAGRPGQGRGSRGCRSSCPRVRRALVAVGAEQPVHHGRFEAEVAVGLVVLDRVVDAVHVPASPRSSAAAVDGGGKAHVAVVNIAVALSSTRNTTTASGAGPITRIAASLISIDRTISIGWKRAPVVTSKWSRRVDAVAGATAAGRRGPSRAAGRPPGRGQSRERQATQPAGRSWWSRPQPSRSPTRASATAVVGSRSRTRTVLRATMPRLLGQRAQRPSDAGRGAPGLQAAITAGCRRKNSAGWRIRGSESVHAWPVRAAARRVGARGRLSRVAVEPLLYERMLV